MRVPFLKRRSKSIPSSYSNGYDLALADFLTGRLSEARQLIQTMMQQKNTGELHNLLGSDRRERWKFVAAVNEYEIAAQMDPSEDNLFDWGSELLLHRTYEPAIEYSSRAASGIQIRRAC